MSRTFYRQEMQQILTLNYLRELDSQGPEELAREQYSKFTFLLLETIPQLVFQLIVYNSPDLGVDIDPTLLGISVGFGSFNLIFNLYQVLIFNFLSPHTNSYVFLNFPHLHQLFSGQSLQRKNFIPFYFREKYQLQSSKYFEIVLLKIVLFILKSLNFTKSIFNKHLLRI